MKFCGSRGTADASEEIYTAYTFIAGQKKSTLAPKVGSIKNINFLDLSSKRYASIARNHLATINPCES